MGKWIIVWDIWQDGEQNRISGKHRWIRNHDRIPAAILCRFKKEYFQKRFSNCIWRIIPHRNYWTILFSSSDSHQKTNPECLVGEMIFVRGDQSVEDRKAIEGYLAHKWKMSDLLPESHPYAEQDLHIDQNGQITINRTFDYEIDASEFSIRARATDLFTGSSIARDISVSLLDLYEDWDGDGVQDHLDTDDDNDGFLDEFEIAYGSNRRTRTR